jgi:methylglutaconyl-CoA hydratase
MPRYETLKVESDRSISTLTLNRPEKRNAISPKMIEELLAALDAVETGSARILIMTGAGKAFCAGMDLDALKTLSAKLAENVPPGEGVLNDRGPNGDAILADTRRIAAMFRKIYGFSKPLIAAVNGAAVAGGCGLATLADFTLAVPEAKFGYTEVLVGFMPAMVSTFLIRQVGEKRARDLLLRGRIMDAEEAQQMGLVNEIVPAAKLLERARALAEELLAMSPTSLTYTKRLLHQFSDAEIEHDLELALQESARIRSTADFREGLAAFLEKRKPRWQGR